MFLKRRRTRPDLTDEIRSHLELDTDDLMSEGLPPAEARAAARRRFGNIAILQERLYESGRLLWLDHLREDIRFAARSLRKYPMTTLVAVLSLAAGIGATTATLAIRDTIFRNPPPLYQQPNQLSEISLGTPRRPRSGVPARLYAIWTAEPSGDQSWAAARSSRTEDVRTTDRADALAVRAVTPNLFSLLGVQPSAGRTFSDLDRDMARAVVLSHRAWQTVFDGRGDVVGETLWIAEQAFTVVGIMPERFWFLDTNASAWTALDIDALPPNETLTVFVRRQPDITPVAFEDKLRAGVGAYAQTLPEGERGMRALVTGIGGTPIGRSVALILPFVLGGCVVLTWFIACINVGILMMAQWTSREHEIAVRAALGAGRGRVVRLLLSESILMALAGGVLGVFLTFALRGLLLHNLGTSLTPFDTSISSSVLLQTAVLTMVTGLLAGVAPALYETRRLQINPLRSMKSERVRQRFRHVLVVAEITATVALLVVTSTMIAGYRRHLSADLGYSTDSLVVMRIENPAGVRSPEVLNFLTGTAGVASAGAATSVPFSAGDGQSRPVGLNAGSGTSIAADFVQIGSTFFETLGVPVRAGRAFTGDEAGGVAIVNEAMAKQLWPATTPIDKQIWVDNARYAVVGVVANYLYFPTDNVGPAVYLPLSAEASNLTRLRFIVRTRTAAGPLIAELRREIRRTASGHVVASAFAANEMIAIGGQEMMLSVYPLVLLIVIGMLLTGSGVYAVLAFAVARRSKEFALRIAIGASGRDVIRLVTASSLRLIVVGSILGTALTFALTRVVRASGGAGSIYDTPDWPAFVVPMLIMLGVGAIATWIPSRRALRAEPALLLRVD